MKALPYVVIGLALLVSACGSSNSSTPTAPTANVPFSTVDLRVGTGAEATLGRNVTVNYSGWVWDSLGTDNKGSRFDAGTFPFTVGQGVIQGFSQGTIGMRVGGLRRVVVPPSLGYGANPPAGSGIRPNETLIFEIELVSVQ
ncbi:MAG TPA: FKBP-type peptidyl-prolyl cis-trans isomerase [Vicinamibacterales bacterium]|nr:FKBP-type peptidyl-prolyl cis-trans isomerase [Vicinamibacterales bacterium]